MPTNLGRAPPTRRDAFGYPLQIPPHTNVIATPAQQITSTLTRLNSTSALGQEWRELEQHSNCAFFISWSWIDPWLKTCADKTELYVYRCLDRSTLVALCILSRRRTHGRRRLFGGWILALHENSAPDLNMCVEYNGLLVRHGYEHSAWPQFIRDVQQAPLIWDELVLSGITEQSWQDVRSAAGELHAIVDEELSPWVVDMASTQTDLEAVIAPMSRNRRWQIRRSLKDYTTEGPIAITAARTQEEALQYFDGLGELHTRRWRLVDKPGAFANSKWVQFHRTLIESAFERSEIQLLCITCNNAAIGYIYSFLWRGRVYMLQTGFLLEKNNVRRPGYISHSLAIALNASNGFRCYDFMCGDSDYKKTFGKAHPPLIWCRLQRPCLKFTIENALVTGFRYIKARLRAA